MTRTIDTITVWGQVYNNVTIETNSKGLFESGYIKGHGKIHKGSKTAEVINNILK